MERRSSGLEYILPLQKPPDQFPATTAARSSSFRTSAPLEAEGRGLRVPWGVTGVSTAELERLDSDALPNCWLLLLGRNAMTKSISGRKWFT